MIAAAFTYRYAETVLLLRRCADLAGWLHPAELAMQATLRDTRRREAWLAGRLLAKELILERMCDFNCEDVDSVSLSKNAAQIEIRPTFVNGRRSRPQVFVRNELQPWSLSIAHTDRGVLVALADADAAAVGVDLVPTAALGAGFARLWFTPAERLWLAELNDARQWATVWGVKEAAYKATQRGETFRPQSIEVLPNEAGEMRCSSLDPTLDRDCQLTVWTTPHQEIAILATHPVAQLHSCGGYHD